MMVPCKKVLSVLALSLGVMTPHKTPVIQGVEFAHSIFRIFGNWGRPRYWIFHGEWGDGGGPIDWNEYSVFGVVGWAIKSLLLRIVGCFIQDNQANYVFFTKCIYLIVYLFTYPFAFPLTNLLIYLFSEFFVAKYLVLFYK